ncbi:helix-turn-helix transcriptional regulator [Pelagibius sp.]|uniref:helix-turn-helix transcriptional regulator n=1 Tax=Pelagibius sp. TaxID=1931238 RepID=UPI003BB2104D
MSDKLLSVPETCQVLGISRAALYKTIQAGDGPTVTKIGRRTLFRETSLERWMAEQEDRNSVLSPQAPAPTDISGLEAPSSEASQ